MNRSEENPFPKMSKIQEPPLDTDLVQLLSCNLSKQSHSQALSLLLRSYISLKAKINQTRKSCPYRVKN